VPGYLPPPPPKKKKKYLDLTKSRIRRRIL
jgi:hypothetical protein